MAETDTDVDIFARERMENRTWQVFFVCAPLVLLGAFGSCTYYGLQEIRHHVGAGHCQGTLQGRESPAWVDCRTGVEAKTP